MKDAIESRVRSAVEAALDKKAIALDVLDVRGLTSIADYFIICSGTSERQTVAIVDAVEEKLFAMDRTKPRLVEGKSSGRWVLVDYGDFILHAFTEECRRFYALERLWGDAPNIAEKLSREPKPKSQRNEKRK